MRDNNEVLLEVLKRSSKIKKEKELRKKKIYAISSIITSFVLIISLSFAMPSFSQKINAIPNNSDMGTFFSNSNFLLYIIIGIVSFVLGIIVTLICYKLKNDNERK